MAPFRPRVVEAYDAAGRRPGSIDRIPDGDSIPTTAESCATRGTSGRWASVRGRGNSCCIVVGVICRLAPSGFGSPAFRSLLRLAAELPEADIDRIISDELPSLEVLVDMDGDSPVAFVAFESTSDELTIEYIAVAQELQGVGIGSRMVGAVVASRPGVGLRAQTDDDAVDFYRKAGFTVEVGTADARWPDRVRYDCRRT